jgi:hypothetical protein
MGSTVCKNTSEQHKHDRNLHKMQKTNPLLSEYRKAKKCTMTDALLTTTDIGWEYS